MKLNSTQKLIAVIVGVVVVAAIFVFALIMPQVTAMSRLDSQILQSEQDLESARTLLSQRQQIKMNAAETETQLLRLSNELPESPELPAFIVELQDILNESGLEFSTLEPGEPTDMTGYQAIPIKIAVDGSWQDVVDLMSRLRRSSRQVRILDFTVNPSGDTETTGTASAIQLTSEVTIEIYTIGPAAQGTAVPAAPASGQ